MTGPAASTPSRIYTEIVKTTVVTETDPASILARDNISLSGHVTNDKSVIVAGGTLGGQTGDIHNIDVKGETIVHRQGTSTWHSTKRSGTGPRKDTWSHTPLNYDLPATRFDLNLWQAKANTVPVDAADPARSQNIKPDSQLFQPVTAPGHPYLIATDLAYTNYHSFLSSDYLLSRLSLDPAAFQKRLGDGYYEQRLINEQLLQKTGRNNLGDTANDEAQFRALMDAGVTYAKQFQLTPGIALSAAQMAALTSESTAASFTAMGPLHCRRHARDARRCKAIRRPAPRY